MGMMDKAKMYGQYLNIKKNLKKADNDSMKLFVINMADDMQLMIKNFDNMVDILHHTQMKLFAVTGKDTVRVNKVKLYKDSEIKEYERIREWCDEVKDRWSKGVDEYEREHKLLEVSEEN